MEPAARETVLHELEAEVVRRRLAGDEYVLVTPFPEAHKPGSEKMEKYIPIGRENYRLYYSPATRTLKAFVLPRTPWVGGVTKLSSETKVAKALHNKMSQEGLPDYSAPICSLETHDFEGRVYAYQLEPRHVTFTAYHAWHRAAIRNQLQYRCPNRRESMVL